MRTAPFRIARLSRPLVAASCLLATLATAAPADSRVWYDDDQPRRVWVDASRVAVLEAPVASSQARSSAAAQEAAAPALRVRLVTLDAADRARVAAGEAPASVRGATLPVFTEARGAGRPMVLSGNALVWLDVGFDPARCAAWLREQGLTALGSIPGARNGFVVAAPPGLPSLELANLVRGRPGARAASPVWWTMAAAR